MATTIVTKSGSGAPAASDLVAGELAVDLTNGRLYTEDSGGTVLELGLNPNGNVNITGTVTADGLTVDGNDSYTSNIKFDYGASAPTYFANWGYKSSSDGNKVFLTITDGGAAKDVLVANYNGNVGIGTATITNPYSQTPHTDVNIDGTWGGVISFKMGGVTKGWVGQRSSGNEDMVIGATAGQELLFYENNVEAMRISSGNVGIGNSGVASTRLAVTGAVVGANIETTSSNTGHEALIINRQNSDGVAIAVNKAGATVGSIGVHSSSLQIGTSNTQIRFADAEDSFYVVNAAGVARDNSHDLGKNGARFKDLHLSGVSYNGDGSATAPSISFGADDNTGFYRVGSDQIGFVTAGTIKAKLDASGNLLVGGTSASAKLIVDAGLSSGETIRADNSKANYAGVNIYSVLLGSGTNNATAVHFQGYAEGATRFQVQGNGAVYGNGTYGTYSDLKLKENIVDANSQWADIKAVQLKNYSMKKDTLSEANQLGVIAQDLEASGMQKLIEEIDDKDVEGNLLGTTTKHVKYSVLHLKALGALQEAMERIESLEARIAALES